MEFLLVIRDGEWKPCAYNTMEYAVQTRGVADCFLTRRARNGNWHHSFSGRLIC